MLITVAVILPLLFFAFSLTLDLSAISVEQGHIQQELDQAALRAFRFLPFQAEARDAARAMLQQRAPEMYGAQGQYLDIKTTGSSIQITLKERPSQVATFLRYFAPRESSFLSVSAVSQVLGTPYDVFFAFGASPSHAPPLTSAASEGWGNEVDWPAGTFFSGDFKIYHGIRQLPDRVATQQCANPLFTAFKKTVIRSYGYFSNFDDDQVGIAVFPGRAGSAMDVIRPVAQRLDLVKDVQGVVEAQFPDYHGKPRQDSYCALLAEHELASSNLKFPDLDARLLHWNPPYGAPAFMVDPQMQIWNQDYNPFLTVPQAVTSVSVRDEESPTFFALTREAIVSLLASKPRALNTNLSAYRHKVAFFFSGEFPTFGAAPWTGSETEMTDSLEHINSFLGRNIQGEKPYQSLTVYYVIVDNPWRVGFHARNALFEDLLKSGVRLRKEMEEKISIRFLYFSSPEELQAKFIPALLAGDRNPVLGG